MSLLDPTAPLRGLLVSLGVGAALFAAGYAYRWSGESERAATAQAESRADYAERDTKATAHATVTAANLEKINDRKADALATVAWLEATRVEYRNVCLPDDGVRLWNAANEGRHVDLQQGDVDRAVPQDAPPDP